MKRNHFGNQKGFTLIEIIAVLVLLGILSAVAVPKFFDMQIEAERKAVSIALNDMNSRIILVYSKSMLVNNGAPDANDFDAWDDFELGTDGDVQAAYYDFAGTWTSDGTTVTYTGANYAGDAFTLVAGDAGPPQEPPTITRTPL